MPKTTPNGETRGEILRAALKRFAHCGYAAASVADIVSDARVTKPSLYYYFPSKAKLYQALVDSAHDERHRLIREAMQRRGTVAERLVEIAVALFEFSLHNTDLMRLAFATAFAAPGEMPEEMRDLTKRRRNYELVRSLVREGQATGELDKSWDSDELAFSVYAQLNTHVMVHLVRPDCRPDRQTAERVVKLFLEGAARKRRH
jgi:TetR/AcrR family transcriptional repressor of mexJK operon